MIDKKERRYQAFAAFLKDFVFDLNQLSEEGWALLVEGKRDANAIRKLGYRGPLVTVATFRRSGEASLGDSKRVVVFTDLDREGAVLAARHVRELNHAGIRTSLAERRRLNRASRGVFLHIENLGRFAPPED